MKHFKSIIGLTFISSFLLSGILLLVLGYLWFQTEKRSMEEGYASFKAEHVASQKEIIRNEVQNVVDFITYSKSLTERRVRDDIKARVYDAHTLATHLYTKYKVTRPQAEIEEIIIEALRPIRFNNGRGYYFITRLDGVEMLFADRPELEGKNIMSMRDTKGKWVIKDMAALVRSKEEGFYDYTWTKPRHEGKDFYKIAFVKYFEPFNWIIGTGEYVDDTEHIIRQEVLDRIGEIRFGTDGYIFVIKTDGTFVSHINKDLEGEDLIDLQDPSGFPVTRELIIAAQKDKDGGFVNYTWIKPSLGRNTDKLSYVRLFEEWDWVIGAGIYLDDLEAALQAAKERLSKRTTQEFKIMAMLFILLLIVLLSLSLYLSKRISRGIKTFDIFFDRAVTSHEKIDQDKIPFEEFKELAVRANVMVEDMAIARKEVDNLNQNLEKQVLDRTAELEEANKELVKLDEMKSSFISTVSHELRTPLTSILGFTKLIARDVKRHVLPMAEENATVINKSQRIIDNLAIMEDEGVRLTRLVSDILDLSKIESGRMEWRREEVRIDQCIGMAVNSLSGQLDSSPTISLEQYIATNLPPVIGDSDKITQVIINLAGNALKFMDKGTIRIEADQIEDGSVQVLVKDEGPGISVEDQAMIFDRFRQATSGKDMAKPSGSGLGLAISKQIIEYFGGTIWVLSEEGKGSCFGFTLPRYK